MESSDVGQAEDLASSKQPRKGRLALHWYTSKFHRSTLTAHETKVVADIYDPV